MCRNTPDSDPALRPGERVDNLELEGLRIIQNPDAFCFGTDSVLLADFARAKKENRVLDLGTGCGVLLLLLWGRYHPQELVGVEIQPQMADIARRNVAFNRLESVARVVEGDYKRHGEAFPKAKFDLVVANPPYVKLGAGAGRENQAHYIARHEVAATLADVVEAASAALITGGRFCMVHHPHRLAEIITAMRAVSYTHLHRKRRGIRSVCAGNRGKGSGLCQLWALPQQDGVCPYRGACLLYTSQVERTKPLRGPS